MDARFTHAKKILEWYLEKCENDETPETKFAIQYANLHIAKFKCTNILDALHSYPIDTSEN